MITNKHKYLFYFLNKMDPTLEPINPIEETPYGAMIIQKDVVCTPTSLCTWSGDEPMVYCRLPQHTLSPECQNVAKGIGLLGCYDEPTCGGFVRKETSENILNENPEYKKLITQEEKRVHNKVKQQKMKIKQYHIILILVLFVLLFMALLWLWGYSVRKTYRKKKHHHHRKKH